MRNRDLARPYVKAIFAIAVASDTLDVWSDLLEQLSFIAQNKLVINFLANPQVNWQQHNDLFSAVCQGKLDKFAINFIRILAMQRRLIILPAIANLFAELKAAQQKIAQVEVISTTALTQMQYEKLKLVLQKHLQSEVKLESKIDAQLIGGIMLKIGDYVIDGSIYGTLLRFKKYLLMRG